MDDPDLAADVAGLARRVEQRIEEKRRAGELPAGLEEELDRYVRAYAAQHAGAPLAQDRARTAVREAASRSPFASAPATIPDGSSRARAGRVAARVMRPARSAPIAQIESWRRSIEDAVVASLEAIDRVEADGLPAARAALTMVLDRLAALEALEDTVADLDERLTILEERLAEPEP